MQRALSLPRSFSSAAASKMMKPPVPQFGIEGRYTTAIYSAAAKEKKLDAVEADLRKIHAQIQKDTKFRDFLINPLINTKQKQEILKQTLQSKLGVDDLTIKLLNVMIETGRLKMIPGVAKSFCKVMELSRGEVECTVTTAKPLSDEAVKKEIEAALKGFTKNKLKIQHQVDESLIGGMIINFGGEHYIDMSIRSKIKMYSDLIQQGV